MIPLPPRWSWRYTAEGVVLSPPEGLAAGAIRYAERVRPLRGVSQLVDDALAGAAGFEVIERLEPRMLITAEGEYAAQVTLRGTVDGGLVQRDFGFVFVDDFYSRLEGMALEPDAFDLFTATVRWLIESDAHMLSGRRRWFFYDRPPGWQARVRGWQTDWYAPDFPRDPVSMTVWPAMPSARGGSIARFVDTLLGQDAGAGWKLTERHSEASVRSPHGPTGTLLHLTGGFPGKPPSHRFVVALEDDHHIYPLRLESAAAPLGASHRALVDSVIASIRPIPRLRREHADLYQHWIK